MARGRQIMCWPNVKLSSAQPRVRRLFLTSMPTFLAWAYTILPGLVKNYHLPAQVSGNNYGTLVYTVNLTIYVPNENIRIGSHVESRESNALKYITNMLLSEQYNMYMYIYYVQVHNGLRTMICLQ